MFHRYEDGSERPIEYISKAFNDAQVKYSQVEKECCGIVNGVIRIKDYLLGRIFILQTDSMPLKLLLPPDASLPNVILRRIDRWSCQLKRLNFFTEYIDTKAFGIVDGLSRLPLNETQQLKKNESQDTTIFVIENLPLSLQKIIEETAIG